ncbi:DUF6624 domain-containing protein [Methylomonas fluvii]|uniref:Uncharacterized protein n=1 Tax=Methylomonas fluvii TaxID=1854564 RepID=A0ABR9DHH2_9GAMM|nr:DUF6624 domain-containing protein [Methylomonas fluvii]MBD9362550.1 hypothetical protein [Methylomonas fluvii]
MHHSNETLSQELVAMAKNDLSVREALVADGSLGRALYHPRMEAIHIGNAARLADIIQQYGWPGNALVGEEGAWVAWLIAPHAIGNPPFMRHCLSLLKQSTANNDVMPWQAAFLEDRIRIYGGFGYSRARSSEGGQRCRSGRKRCSPTLKILETERQRSEDF